jgi:hypothetical protein
MTSVFDVPARVLEFVMGMLYGYILAAVVWEFRNYLQDRYQQRYYGLRDKDVKH